MQEIGSFEATVQEAGGNLTLTPSSGSIGPITVGDVNASFAVTTVSGGAPPYTFEISAGAVPDGMALNSEEQADTTETITLDGTATTAGVFDFEITVTDSEGAQAKIGTSTKRPIGQAKAKTVRQRA